MFRPLAVCLLLLAFQSIGFSQSKEQLIAAMTAGEEFSVTKVLELKKELDGLSEEELTTLSKVYAARNGSDEDHSHFVDRSGLKESIYIGPVPKIEYIPQTGKYSQDVPISSKDGEKLQVYLGPSCGEIRLMKVDYSKKQWDHGWHHADGSEIRGCDQPAIDEITWHYRRQMYGQWFDPRVNRWVPVPKEPPSQHQPYTPEQ